MGILEVLFCIFLTLKVLGVLDWSWWWVCVPLYPAIIIMFITGLIIWNIDR